MNKEIKKKAIEFDKLKFGKILVQLREEKEKKIGKKLTQVEASKNIGMGLNTLNTYERGRSLPQIEQLMKIKNYYNVPYEYLLGETDDKNYNTDEQAIKNRKAINDIKKILTDLNN